MYLQNYTWPEVSAMDIGSKIVVLPLGSIEQHGHHLPVSTDSDLAGGVAVAVERRMPQDLVLLPTLWCGHSTHHLAFPGTVSVSQGVYQALIGELCDSLVKMGARKVLLLNGHGGNDLPVRYALRDVKTRHADVAGLKIVFASYWALAAQTLTAVRESGIGGMGHACEMETSLMLVLNGEHVAMNKARRDGPAQVPPYRLTDMQQGLPYYLVEDFHELSETGTVGHPDLASREKGERFLAGIVDEVCAFIHDFQQW